MRKPMKVLIAAAIPLSILGLVAATSLGASTDWPCKEQMHVHGDAVPPGYPDQMSARQGAVALLSNVAPGFKVSETDTAAALSSASGPDRYDEATGKMFVNDVLVAQFTVEKLPDGTYLPGELTTCAPVSSSD